MHDRVVIPFSTAGGCALVPCADLRFFVGGGASEFVIIVFDPFFGSARLPDAPTFATREEACAFLADNAATLGCGAADKKDED